MNSAPVSPITSEKGATASIANTPAKEARASAPVSGLHFPNKSFYSIISEKEATASVANKRNSATP